MSNDLTNKELLSAAKALVEKYNTIGMDGYLELIIRLRNAVEAVEKTTTGSKDAG